MSQLLGVIKQATAAGKQANATVEAYYNGLATVRLSGGTRLTGLKVYGAVPAVGANVIVDYSGTTPIVLTAGTPEAAGNPLGVDLAPENTNINESNSNVLMSTLVLPNSTYGKIGTFVASSGLAFGDAVYFNSGSGMSPASANSIATAKVVGLCASSLIGAGATGQFLLEGFINCTSWGWTPGEYVYLEDGSGEMTHTPPTPPTAVQGNCVVICGVAYTSTILYFRPSLSIVELL